MKKIFIGVFAFGCLIATDAFAQNDSDTAAADFETRKRELVDIQLWQLAHPYVKVLSVADFISRPKTERDHMLMRGVLVYEGTELRMTDIARFETNQHPAAVQAFLNEETALTVWLQMHPHVYILSSEKYNSLDANDKAFVDAKTDKIIYPGAKLTYADVLNY